VARLGGDEFAVILTNLETAADAGAIAQKMLKALALPFSLGHENIYISASIGITLASSECELLDDLFKQADQAMYVAKSRGRNGVSFFTPESEAQSQTRLRTTHDPHQAWLLNQFFVLYQPIVDLATGRVDKVEALLRWHHPERGLIEPSEFIPLAESSGLILKIGDWVFRQVAQQVLEWRQTLPRRVQVAVNTSPLQFRNDTRSPQYWAQHLKSMGLEGGDVEIEITEGLLLGASERVQQQLLNLQKTGI
jgi:predicted signal transduction protein with EAL and GGDEF domain